MGESKITRRGGVGVGTKAPTINFVSKTDSSITVTFKNNDSEEATIFYGLTTPPTDDSVVLAADTTSGNITFSELDDDTTFTIFAFSKTVEKQSSQIVSIQVTTDELIRTFIYNLGNENTSFTGGWFVSGTQTGATATKETDHLRVTAQSSGDSRALFVTNNQIDVTNFSILRVDIEITNSNTSVNSNVRLGLASNVSGLSFTDDAFYASSSSHTRRIEDINISQLTGFFTPYLFTVSLNNFGNTEGKLYSMELIE